MARRKKRQLGLTKDQLSHARMNAGAQCELDYGSGTLERHACYEGVTNLVTAINRRYLTLSGKKRKR
jgi:hypothetical protein